MTTSALLTSLRSRGFALSLSAAGRPQVAPFSQLTPADLAALKEHRAGIVSILAREEDDARYEWAEIDGRRVLLIGDEETRTWARNWSCPAFEPLNLSSLGRMVQALEDSR